MRETVLIRFPAQITIRVQSIIQLFADEPEVVLDLFVQCLGMLHAYTGLPSGEKSQAELDADRRALYGGVAGQAMKRIVRGPY